MRRREKVIIAIVTLGLFVMIPAFLLSITVSGPGGGTSMGIGAIYWGLVVFGVVGFLAVLGIYAFSPKESLPSRRLTQ